MSLDPIVAEVTVPVTPTDAVVPAAAREQTRSVDGPADALTIGGNAVWSEWFAGLVDEVRIYNRALTQGEIQAGMSQTLGGT